jgi:hypothetical protein
VESIIIHADAILCWCTDKASPSLQDLYRQPPSKRASAGGKDGLPYSWYLKSVNRSAASEEVTYKT